MTDRRSATERRRDRQRVLMNPTPEEMEACQTLAPFMRAGLDGLERSRWHPSQWTKIEDLVAPARDIEHLTIGERLGDEDGYDDLTEDEQDALADEIHGLIAKATVTVELPEASGS